MVYLCPLLPIRLGVAEVLPSYDHSEPKVDGNSAMACLPDIKEWNKWWNMPALPYAKK